MSSDITPDIQIGMQTSMLPNMQPVTQACTPSRIIACSYACMPLSMQANMQAESKKRCPLGLSITQINIISIVRNARLPLSYQHIADLMLASFQTNATEGIVRGAISRLKRNGFLLSKYTSLGKRRGNTYTIMPLACPHIPSIVMQANVLSNMHPHMHPAPSTLEDRIDSKLSISYSCRQALEALTEDDITFHWEHLARNGFGTYQIRQIISRLEQVNISLENVMQGLHYAEWALCHQTMKDKQGNHITKPVDWVFSILAKQGYYPRPKEYISPTEQAEQDATQELRAIQEAKNAHRELVYNTWLSNLNAEEQSNIFEGYKQASQSQFPIPNKVILETHFEKKVWPQHQKAVNRTS